LPANVSPMDAYRRVFDSLVAAGWKVRERDPHSALTATELWPAELRARYPNVPSALTEFLGRIDHCMNASETAWFLTAADYAGTSDSVWAWNEWERQELETFASDEKVKAEVREFWKAYLPFYLDVGGDYAYFAVRVTEPPPRKPALLPFLREPPEPPRGAVVYGADVDLRGVSVVAASFPEFLEHLTTLLRNPAADTPLTGLV
jgi:hypothetical protein